jgi:pimeloyl-ACP methyl ester carboxylesterase
MRRCSSVVLALALGACTTNARRVEQVAAEGGLTRAVYSPGTFDTLIYMKREEAAGPGPLVVFLEGDGQLRTTSLEPFVETAPKYLIALELALHTPARVAYVVRPCHAAERDPKCDLEQWRTARYSIDVVDSLVAGVREAARIANAREVELVGYSGGGTLAVLIAERLQNVSRVITVAANLDTDAWASLHGYPALSRSLNPALSERPHAWREVHLFGTEDQVVPRVTTSKYFERHPDARRLEIEGADHTCCWVRRWPELWQQVTALR